MNIMRLVWSSVLFVSLIFAQPALSQQIPSNGLRGTGLYNFFRTQGVTLSAPADEPVVMYGQGQVYDGQAVSSARGGVLVLQQGGHPCHYSLTFDTPLDSISFNRSHLKAGPSGVTHPVWSATAYDISGNVLGSVGEAEIRSYVDVPAQRFTLNGPGIKTVVFAGDDKGIDGFCNVVIDTMDTYQ